MATQFLGVEFDDPKDLGKAFQVLRRRLAGRRSRPSPLLGRALREISPTMIERIETRHGLKARVTIDVDARKTYLEDVGFLPGTGHWQARVDVQYEDGASRRRARR